eukprot:GILJ01003511.1.p1 GENE.GILJ01003511.1~~GILJ01003511.1.p1  ORF type:complete len:499 (-),score=60.04 GILJ01003511.1:198-1628(-)
MEKNAAKTAQKTKPFASESSFLYEPVKMLFILALAIRLYQLPNPSQVVFDEVHFGEFTQAYLSGKYFFDIHPPLGKLLLAGIAYLSGYEPVVDFKKIGNSYDTNKYVILRALPALFGALNVSLMYLAARNMGISKIASVLAASMLLLDISHLVESRLIVTDSFLFCFLTLFLYCYLKSRSCEPLSRTHRRWMMATGIALACASSVKWTAAASVGAVAVFEFLSILPMASRPFLFMKHIIVRAVMLLIVPFAVYLSTFMMHIYLLPYSGPGDIFMTPEWRSKNILDQIYELHRTMFAANAGVTSEHPWASRWWQWPVNSGGILYWVQDRANDTIGRIYLTGNPPVYWVALLCVVLSLVVLLFLVGKAFENGYRRLVHTDAHYLKHFFLHLMGYVFNLIPFVLVARSMFLYHYMPALIHAVLLTALVFDYFFVNRSKNIQFGIAGVLLAVFVAGFIYLSPFVYASSLDRNDTRLKLWT